MTGKQKAAMLLMILDATTASKLLKDVEPKVVQEMALELAYLDAAGQKDTQQSVELAREFCGLLRTKKQFHLKSFLEEMLKSTVGDEQAAQIQKEIEDTLQKRDPFMSIRSAEPQTLAMALYDEHPQVVASVLSELPAKSSSEILGLLDEELRYGVISRMTSSETVNIETKVRIAEIINERLNDVSLGSGCPSGDKSLRKVAVILRNLGKELRDGMLESITEKDNKAGEKVMNLMVIWEDIPQIADRPLQEALRTVETSRLALALSKADGAITKKIKSNISERAAALVEEETSVISLPSRFDIQKARESIVQILREANEKGKLIFIED